MQRLEPILFFKVMEAIWPSLIFLQGKGRLVAFDLLDERVEGKVVSVMASFVFVHYRLQFSISVNTSYSELRQT